MAFFKQFPKVQYDFERNGVITNVVNIYRSVRPLQDFIDNSSAYTFYEVKNGERPDVTSQRLYDNPNYYWTFFVVNDILHDGMRAWPMSQEDLFDYIAIEYEGYAITTNPTIVRNTDGIITKFEDSLAGSVPNVSDGAFTLGETVNGSISGFSGKLTKKNVDMNQLIVQEVNSNAPLGDPNAISGGTELLVGATSGDSVGTYQAFKYAEAPHHYFTTGDKEKRYQTNGEFIQGGAAAGTLSYQTNRSYVNELNETRSRIRVVDPQYIDRFADEFERILNV
tara:strand:- start:1701 stop:2540 length:840 start_codon:yes stop_codon:yes gene_type:complete